MSNYSLPMFITQSVPTTTAARLGVGKRLMGFLLYPAAANSSVEFKDATTDTGTVLLTASTLANQSLFVDLTPFGGILGVLAGNRLQTRSRGPRPLVPLLPDIP